MNRFMQEKWPWIEGSHEMRSQLLDVLSDAELAFNPGGQNMTLARHAARWARLSTRIYSR